MSYEIAHAMDNYKSDQRKHQVVYLICVPFHDSVDEDSDEKRNEGH